MSDLRKVKVAELLGDAVTLSGAKLRYVADEIGDEWIVNHKGKVVPLLFRVVSHSPRDGCHYEPQYFYYDEDGAFVNISVRNRHWDFDPWTVVAMIFEGVDGPWMIGDPDCEVWEPEGIEEYIAPRFIPGVYEWAENHEVPFAWKCHDCEEYIHIYEEPPYYGVGAVGDGGTGYNYDGWRCHECADPCPYCGEQKTEDSRAICWCGWDREKDGMIEKGEWWQCDDCGEVYPDTLERCPECGSRYASDGSDKVYLIQDWIAEHGRPEPPPPPPPPPDGQLSLM